MSQEQKDSLDTMLRELPLDLGGDVKQQRAIFEEMMSQLPPLAGISTKPRALGGTSTLSVSVEGASGDNVILYVHGGAFAIGTAASSVPLAGDLARRARTNLITVDYRLAPEHPFPAAIDDVVAVYDGLLEDGVTPDQIAIAGESAGAGLVLSVLLSLRDTSRPLPAAAVLMSPWADLTLTGDSLVEQASVDPVLTTEALRTRARDYAGEHDPSIALISPGLADLRELPALLIQVGSHEVLLGDAVGVARHAGAADVDVRLEIVAGVPHVFQSYAAMLDEGSAALDRAASFIVEHR
jgi:epsilon-lactone hydrolase